MTIDPFGILVFLLVSLLLWLTWWMVTSYLRIRRLVWAVSDGVLIRANAIRERIGVIADVAKDRRSTVRTFTITANVISEDDDAVRNFLAAVNDQIETVLADEETMKGITEVEVGHWIEQVRV